LNNGLKFVADTKKLIEPKPVDLSKSYNKKPRFESQEHLEKFRQDHVKMKNGLSVAFRKLIYKNEILRLEERENARLRLNS
jgi:hypothetical protein